MSTTAIIAGTAAIIGALAWMWLRFARIEVDHDLSVHEQSDWHPDDDHSWLRPHSADQTRNLF